MENKEKNELVSEKKDEQGATMIEYVLLVALIAVVVIAIITFLGESVSTKFSQVASAVAP